eukprot:scaffold124019_cov68-Attheya_sp.AAC.1
MFGNTGEQHGGGEKRRPPPGRSPPPPPGRRAPDDDDDDGVWVAPGRSPPGRSPPGRNAMDGVPVPVDVVPVDVLVVDGVVGTIPVVMDLEGGVMVVVTDFGVDDAAADAKDVLVLRGVITTLLTRRGASLRRRSASAATWMRSASAACATRTRS